MEENQLNKPKDMFWIGNDAVAFYFNKRIVIVALSFTKNYFEDASNFMVE
jgi:hypothetical protein